MKTLLFVILLNLPNGSQQEVVVARDLDFATCDRMQRAIWDAPTEAAYVDAEGPVPLVDAACMYPAQFSQPQ
jgi:hypothetical protein